MFVTILHANDGSEHAFKALLMALDLAKQSGAALHMVSVEEISYMPEYIEEVREEKATAARRFHAVLQRAKTLAGEREVTLQTHVLAGHPVRDVVERRLLHPERRVHLPRPLQRRRNPRRE